MSNWQAVLMAPAETVLTQVGEFLTSVLLVIVILIIGWIIAKVIQTLVVKILKIVKLDDLSDRVELDSVLAKGGIKQSLSEVIGVVCYWVVMLVTVVIAVNAIGLTVAADLLNKVVLYLPNVIAAIFILILAMFAATILSSIVQTAANNAGIGQSALLGKIVEVVVMIFAAVMSLEQLGIAADLIKMTVTIVLASAGLATALAFGLGCKDIAGRFLGDLIDKIKRK
jgi:hypothetical protein